MRRRRRRRRAFRSSSHHLCCLCSWPETSSTPSQSTSARQPTHPHLTPSRAALPLLLLASPSARLSRLRAHHDPTFEPVGVGTLLSGSSSPPSVPSSSSSRTAPPRGSSSQSPSVERGRCVSRFARAARCSKLRAEQVLTRPHTPTQPLSAPQSSPQAPPSSRGSTRHESGPSGDRRRQRHAGAASKRTPAHSTSSRTSSSTSSLRTRARVPPSPSSATTCSASRRTTTTPSSRSDLPATCSSCFASPSCRPYMTATPTRSRRRRDSSWASSGSPGHAHADAASSSSTRRRTSCSTACARSAVRALRFCPTSTRSSCRVRVERASSTSRFSRTFRVRPLSLPSPAHDQC